MSKVGIVKEDLPTEGVTIAGVRFFPGKAEAVDAKLAEALTKNKRKGFKRVDADMTPAEKPRKAKSQKEVTDDDNS